MCLFFIENISFVFLSNYFKRVLFHYLKKKFPVRSFPNEGIHIRGISIHISGVTDTIKV